MHSIKNPIVILNSVDSTNNYAMGMIRDGLAEHGKAWFTYEQTHGKGRRGKAWKAQAGKNILMSIAIVPQSITVYDQFKLSIAVSLGCLQFFSKYAGDKVSLKWPNDLFWNDRKAGGVLIENIISGDKWQWSVAGIGININQHEFEINSNFLPVSLKQITGKEYDVIAMAKELYECVMENIDELHAKNFAKMLDWYNQNIFRLNEKVKLKKDNIVFETTISGVSPQGQLITYDSMERRFDFEEVEWVL